MYKALKVANLKKGAWVATAGPGDGLGHLTLQYAKAMGLRPWALNAEKQDICTALGAEAYIDFIETADVVAEVIKFTEGGAQRALIEDLLAWKHLRIEGV